MNGIHELRKLESARSVNQRTGTKRSQKNSDLTGKRFGRLVVVEKAERGKFKELRLSCVCDCGKKKNVARYHLLSGDVKSCGCWLKDFSATHRMSYTRTYTSWEKMISRCENKGNDRYADYGGRGVKVCNRWKVFENFLKDMGKRPKGKTIDRVDNDGNYEPWNCKWSTPKEQQRNSRSNVVIKYNGESMCVSEWAEKLGINHSTLRKRLSRGWTVARALETIVL